MARMRIGEVAERTGFTASAVRFYEDHGILPPADRTEAGYRTYDDRAVARLQFVARAKGLGCTLEEITSLVAAWDGDDCDDVQQRLSSLVADKQADARRRIAELEAFAAQLDSAAARLAAPPAGTTSGGCGPECGCMTEPIACTLPTEELPARLDDWAAALDVVTGREPVDGGMRLSLRRDADLAGLAKLIEAEQSCCSFFSFALTVDGRGAALEVRAPAEAGDAVHRLFGAAV